MRLVLIRLLLFVDPVARLPARSIGLVLSTRYHLPILLLLPPGLPFSSLIRHHIMRFHALPSLAFPASFILTSTSRFPRYSPHIVARSFNSAPTLFFPLILSLIPAFAFSVWALSPLHLHDGQSLIFLFPPSSAGRFLPSPFIVCNLV